MAKPKVKVLVNGYGVIGKRVADAITKQDDMELVGVSDIVADWRVKMAVKKGYRVYCSSPDRVDHMRKSGIKVEGLITDIIKDVDVVVDCTPAGVGAKNKEIYVKYGVKAVFEGGEAHETAGTSFVATCNYDESVGKQFTRVVSCNTTALCRVLNALNKAFNIVKARAVIVRRACDVWESHRAGIINTVVPELHVPSHHGPDVKTVLHDVDIVTLAAKGSHNLYHIHFCIAEMKVVPTRNEVLKTLEEEPRVTLVSGRDGVEALNSIVELARDLGRPRGDLYEIPVWEDSVSVNNNEVYLMWATPNESNVIPDNIDAIRALTGLERDWRVSVRKTDKSLGVLSKLY
ncbi:MAG: type II glyceraldehyde-3-phosphate dehydrogenase [Candidatus Nezhaarchaeota archaeon]|nr:type II glyceraldehyde-3-phosphate dehydrogenase [Candidatus Nezhaarchaeota archaeon]MCX8141854.1 type II glyceraldehyde-3-phosphate dehydrogenase [Candidatus Nezhaarchaeota archaeon]MDW8050365.1 type II glyceraldehyde-3-phosphate dehydrogenase [Nitrososphaerota archaeon]